MSKKRNNLVNNINPLNLKDNYGDNVTAFKLLLNLSNDEELKKLGLEIIDSFMLLNLIKDNKLLKNVIPSYNILINRLSCDVNKYSKFEKILRNKDVKTGAFLSDKYLFLSDLNNKFSLIGMKSKMVMNCDKSYILIDKNISNINEGYSLNTILNQSKLLSIILFKDKKKKFDKNNIFRENNIHFSQESEELLEEKKKLFTKTISLDSDISNKQFELFCQINNLHKKLIFLENEIYSLEKIINIIDNKIFILSKETKELYISFINECKEEYKNAVRERIFVHTSLGDMLNEYKTTLSKTYIIDNDKKNDKNRLTYNTKLINERKKVIKSYLLYRLNNYSSNNKQSLISFMKNNSVDSRLLDLEMLNYDDYLSMYSSYLIYKVGVDNQDNVIPFEKYVKDVYGIDKIDPIYSLTV